MRTHVDELMRLIGAKNATILELTDEKHEQEQIELHLKSTVSSDHELLQYQDRVIELLTASAHLTDATKALFIEENMGNNNIDLVKQSSCCLSSNGIGAFVGRIAAIQRGDTSISSGVSVAAVNLRAKKLNMTFFLRLDIITAISQTSAQLDRSITHYEADLSKLEKAKERRRAENRELAVLRGKLRRMGSF